MPHGNGRQHYQAGKALDERLSIVLGRLAAWLVLGAADPARRLTGSVIVLAGITAIAAS